MKTITANCAVDGHLRYGHYELKLTDEEYEEYSKLDEFGKKEWIRESGSLTVDDWEVDYADIFEITED